VPFDAEHAERRRETAKELDERNERLAAVDVVAGEQDEIRLLGLGDREQAVFEASPFLDVEVGHLQDLQRGPVEERFGNFNAGPLDGGPVGLDEERPPGRDREERGVPGRGDSEGRPQGGGDQRTGRPAAKGGEAAAEGAPGPESDDAESGEGKEGSDEDEEESGRNHGLASRFQLPASGCQRIALGG